MIVAYGLRLPVPEGLPSRSSNNPDRAVGGAQRDLTGRPRRPLADLRPKAQSRGAGAPQARSDPQPFSPFWLCSGSLMAIPLQVCWRREHFNTII
jgi:hypothetical protein